MGSESARKEFRELTAIIRRRGYKVAPGGKGGHFKILDKKGRQVIDDHGPVIMSGTPGDFRARDLLAARLERAGILTADDLPWKPEKKKDKGGKLLLGGEARNDPKVRAALQTKTESRARHERTQEIRARLEPLLSRLGGWTKRGMQAEMSQVVYNYNKGAPHGFKSKQAALANVQNLKKGGTLGDDAATCWEALLDDLEQAEVMRERWWDLVRDARGLPSRTVTAFATEARSIVDPKPEKDLKVLLSPESEGTLRRDMERRWGDGERYTDAEHPVLEFHRDGGVRWNVDVTVEDMLELQRAVGFFEGLAVQLSVFEGQELVGPALDKIRTFIVKVSEARIEELKARNAS